jgi:peptidoglycan glycosyltransferase
MNAPLRRLAIVAALLFVSLLTSATYIQFVSADSLNNRPGNVRSLYKQFDRPRGALLLNDNRTVIADSVPVKDFYGYQRRYPGGAQYSAVTGYFSVVYGQTGLESTESDLLSGTGDQQFIQRVSDLFTGRQTNGNDVKLTIDPQVQRAAWNALGNQRGAVVAMDPKTGAILALVSKPGFDPNLLAVHNGTQLRANWQQLLKDPNRPMDNRTIAGREYAPGSVFKVLTAATALSSGNYTPDTQVPGPAQLTLPQSNTPLPNDFTGDCGSGGQPTLLHALVISCNTAYGGLGMTLGEKALHNQVQAFGFDRTLQIPLRVSPSKFSIKPDGTLSQAEVAYSAIGQLDVRVTPLQICMVSAAIANKGTLMQPYLVDSVLGPDLQVRTKTDQKELGKPISENVASQLTTMMQAVVDDPQGTGRQARIDNVSVAGKTGTAQQAQGQPPNAWFTAFAPADNPKVAVAVVVEDGGTLNENATGGQVAAPIAKKVIQAVLKQ